MAGFLDIAKRSKTLEICGASVSVAALGLGDIADLAMRFKPFQDLITRNPAFSLQELLACGRPFIAELIARAVGHPTPEGIAKADELGAGEQSLILLALYEVGFPEDVRGPFAEALKRLFGIELSQADELIPEESSDAAS